MTTYRKTGETFGTTMLRVFGLPDFVTDKAFHVKEALMEWQKLNSLVAEVCVGKTTFEAEIEPIVTANCEVTCIAAEYEGMAKEVSVKLADFFDLSFNTFIVPTWGALVIPCTVDLRTPPRVTKRHQWLHKHYPNIYFFFEPKLLALRREFAERLLKEAKDLDMLIKNAKTCLDN